MTNSDNSIFYKKVNPLFQAAIVLGLGLVIMIGGKLLGMTNVLKVSELFPWMTTAAFLLFFAMFNSIFSLSAKDLNKYWTTSILSYAGLAVGLGLSAYLISSISVNDAGSYRWIITILTFGYLVFLSMVGFIKRIVEFAEKEEWNSPKQRKRK